MVVHAGLSDRERGVQRERLKPIVDCDCPELVLLRDFPCEVYPRYMAANYAAKQRREYPSFNIVCSRVVRVDGVAVYRVGIWL